MADLSLSAPEGTTGTAPSLLSFGAFTLDLHRAELRRGSTVVPLAPKPFALLRVFAQRPGVVLTKEQLLQAVWPGVVVGDASLTQCVHELREALGGSRDAPLKTVSRRGYRFDAEVTSSTGATGPTGAPSPPAAPAALAAPASRAIVSARLMAAAAFVVAVLAAVGLHVVSRTPAVPGPASPPPMSMVLLPLATEATADAAEWFSDALTADLTSALGMSSGMLVTGRDTAAHYKGQRPDPREVGRALGVRYVVHGTVRREGDLVRLRLEMADGETGAQQWAGSFELTRAELASGIGEIASQVARSLNVQIYRSAGARAAALPPERVQSDDVAMQGWGAYFRGFSAANLTEALKLFEQAAARDPASVRALGGVAVMSTLGAGMGWLRDREAALRRAEAAAEQLHRLDAEHLYTWLAKANIASVRGNYDAALELYRIIIARHRSHAPSYGSIAMNAMNSGRFDECIAPARQAIKLSPRDPMLGLWHWFISFCHFARGEYSDAARAAQTAELTNPNLPMTPLLRAAALQREGHAAEARSIAAAYLAAHPGAKAADLEKVCRSQEPRFIPARSLLVASMREAGMP